MKRLLSYLMILSLALCLTPVYAQESANSARITVSLEVDTGFGYQSVPLVLRYTNYDGVHADGIVFMGETTYALNPLFGEIPAASLSSVISYRVLADDDVTVTGGYTLYRYDQGEFTIAARDTEVPDFLSPGRYLLCVSVNAHRSQNSYYQGCGFLWLNAAEPITTVQQ